VSFAAITLYIASQRVFIVVVVVVSFVIDSVRKLWDTQSYYRLNLPTIDPKFRTVVIFVPVDT
jgi:hypothetical protein